MGTTPNQTNRVITDRHFPICHSTAQLLVVIRTISSVSKVNPFQTSSTDLLTWSALPSTRLAKWQGFRTENSVPIKFRSGLHWRRKHLGRFPDFH